MSTGNTSQQTFKMRFTLEAKIHRRRCANDVLPGECAWICGISNIYLYGCEFALSTTKNCLSLNRQHECHSTGVNVVARCLNNAHNGQKAMNEKNLAWHHHLDELLVVDLAITVDVGLADHLIDLLISELLAQIGHDVTQLRGGDKTSISKIEIYQIKLNTYKSNVTLEIQWQYKKFFV